MDLFSVLLSSAVISAVVSGVFSYVVYRNKRLTDDLMSKCGEIKKLIASYYYWLKAHSYTYKLLSVKEQGASDSDIEYLFNQGLLACNEGETFSYENKVRLSKILILKALLYDCVGDINGRKYLIGALDTNDSDDKQYAWNLYINATEWLKKIFENHHNLDYKEGDESFSGEDIYKDVFMFTKMPEEERKFIYIVQDDNSISGCYDSKGNIDWVFTKQYYPSDIAFPLGHPVSNTLYVLNPTNKYEYLPYAEHLFSNTERFLHFPNAL